MRLVRVFDLSPAFVIGLVIAVIGCSKSPADVTQGDAQPTEEGCPKNLPESNGKPCRQEGKTCSGGSNVRMLMCTNGKWSELNLPPMPQPPASAR